MKKIFTLLMLAIIGLSNVFGQFTKLLDFNYAAKGSEPGALFTMMVLTCME